MARYVGDQSKVVMLHESGLYGTVSGTGQWLGLIQEHDVSENINTQEIRYAGQASRDVGAFVDTALDAKGKFKFYPQDFRMMAYALGSCVDGGSPSPYTHTLVAVDNNVGNAFTSGTLNPFLSFSIEESVAAPGTGLNKVKTANGCVIESYDIGASQGGIVESNVEYVAQSVTYGSGTPTAVTPNTIRPLLWADAKLHIVSGTVYSELRDWSFKVNNNLNAPHYNNGSKVIAVPIPESRSYALDITIDATSEKTKTLYESYFKGGSTFNALLDITCVDAGTGSRDCFITMSGCKLEAFEDPMKTVGVENQKLKIVPQTVTVLVDDVIFKYMPW